MDTKLTLKLDKDVIERAKKYAAERRTSLSRMVEAYLEAVVPDKMPAEQAEITPFVKSLSEGVRISDEMDPKSEFYGHVAKKHA